MSQNNESLISRERKEFEKAETLRNIEIESCIPRILTYRSIFGISVSIKTNRLWFVIAVQCNVLSSKDFKNLEIYEGICVDNYY